MLYFALVLYTLFKAMISSAAWNTLCLESLLFHLCLINSVSADCKTDIGSINDTLIRLKEDTPEYVFINITTKDENWTFDVAEVNNNKLSTPRKNNLTDYFHFSTNNATVLLTLKHALDKELLYNIMDQDVQAMTLELTCSDNGKTSPPIHQPIIVSIESVDEFPPSFDGAPFYTSISENTPVGTHIYSLDRHVTDADIPRDIQFIYAVDKYPVTKVDGSDKFGIPYGATGEIVLERAVDYEEMKRDGIKFYILLISVTDSGGISTNTTLNITVTDSDDLGPMFMYPGCNDSVKCSLPTYSTNTTLHYRGSLEVQPEIIAKDRDSFNDVVLFSLKRQADGYESSFEIDTITGKLTQISDVFKSGVLVIKATENSTNQQSSIASILVLLNYEVNQTSQFNNETNTVGSSSESSINLKTILIIVSVTCSIAMISLMVGLCIQHRRYIQSTRPVQNLSYLYIRSFKRRKAKVADNDESKKYIENGFCVDDITLPKRSDEQSSSGSEETIQEQRNCHEQTLINDINRDQIRTEVNQHNFQFAENSSVNGEYIRHLEVEPEPKQGSPNQISSFRDHVTAPYSNKNLHDNDIAYHELSPVNQMHTDSIAETNNGVDYTSYIDRTSEDPAIKSQKDIQLQNKRNPVVSLLSNKVSHETRPNNKIVFVYGISTSSSKMDDFVEFGVNRRDNKDKYRSQRQDSENIIETDDQELFV